MKQLLLVGIGKESLLEDMGKYQNFLIFKQENGSTIRIHVPEDSVKELVTELQGKPADPPDALRGADSSPLMEALNEAAEFGGDQEEQPLPESEEEELESEEDVASL